MLVFQGAASRWRSLKGTPYTQASASRRVWRPPIVFGTDCNPEDDIKTVLQVLEGLPALVLSPDNKRLVGILTLFRLIVIYGLESTFEPNPNGVMLSSLHFASSGWTPLGRGSDGRFGLRRFRAKLTPTPFGTHRAFTHALPPSFGLRSVPFTVPPCFFPLPLK